MTVAKTDQYHVTQYHSRYTMTVQGSVIGTLSNGKYMLEEMYKGSCDIWYADLKGQAVHNIARMRESIAGYEEQLSAEGDCTMTAKRITEYEQRIQREERTYGLNEL